MGRSEFKVLKGKRDGFSDLGLQWSLPEGSYHPGGLFASVGQVGNNMGFGISPNSPNSRDNNGGFKLPYTDLYVKYVSSPEGFRIVGVPEGTEEEGLRKKKSGMKLKIKIANPSLRRLISGAVAGAVSRTAVAPLETIRTHLMVGSSGHSSTEVFHNIMKTDGWKGLFRGNFVNVIRVAPSKAIEVKIKMMSFDSFLLELFPLLCLKYYLPIRYVLN
ncbi:adenine nucleotide transporter BT1, chloroplastic/mitochondrial-like [Camellia sinensis]|uniref:adenine nucleotide transporter BT1, chloroplastic/mitochondrial-like n=1 Tax=Camellia sinensis TaxID=4442 RepID=UPI0010364E2E|nr:adenine nucleotide transporter BT1, chloroplastic/mitochondrial-like [Camellia sinensis]